METWRHAGIGKHTVRGDGVQVADPHATEAQQHAAVLVFVTGGRHRDATDVYGADRGGREDMHALRDRAGGWFVCDGRAREQEADAEAKVRLGREETRHDARRGRARGRSCLLTYLLFLASTTVCTCPAYCAAPVCSCPFLRDCPGYLGTLPTRRAFLPRTPDRPLPTMTSEGDLAARFYPPSHSKSFHALRRFVVTKLQQSIEIRTRNIPRAISRFGKGKLAGRAHVEMQTLT